MFFYSGWQIRQYLSPTFMLPDPTTDFLQYASQSFVELLVIQLIQSGSIAAAAVGLHRLVLFGGRSPVIGAGPVEMRFFGVAVAVAAGWVAYFYITLFATVTMIQHSVF